MITNDDRSEINRLLAKAIAYKNCGKHEAASEYAKLLVRMMECHDILVDAEPVKMGVA